jgi:hypothetical protein
MTLAPVTRGARPIGRATRERLAQEQALHPDGGMFLHAPGHSVRWWKRARLPG